MFSLGLVLLELDNIQTFDFTKTTNQQKFEIQLGNIFSSFQINRQSQIYRIVKQCIEFDPKNRTPPVDLLIQFIVQNQNYLDVEISSILNKKQLLKKAEQLTQIQKSVVEKSKKQEIELLQISQIYKDQKFEMLIQEFKQLKEKPFEIFEYQIILDLLLKNTQYDSNFEFISVGATGLILGVYNKSYKRHSALKIQRVSSKHEIVREIGIIRDCQMPLVIKFYGFFYLDVTKKEDFVVYEIEKCSGNLKQYFNRLKKDKIQLNDEEKMQIAIQVIDVINYLHYNDIVHRDIKLENILYIDDNQSQVPIIKLTDFDQARKMHYELIQINDDILKDYKSIKGACGTLGYISPEIFNTLLYTFQSEIFSLGVTLAVIDNFETLEPYLKQKNLDYLHGFKIPFEPSHLVTNELIKRNTKIYDIILNTVVFNQEKRKDLYSIMADLHENYGYQFYSKEITFFQNIPSHFVYCKIASFVLSNNIGPDGAKAVASEIAKCPTLSTLSLYLQSNNIGPDGAKAVASEIAKCPTLSTLTLDLQSNNIGPDGAKAVASEIAKCPTLSTLTLGLDDNNIGPDGAKAVASEIAKCPTLSTLSLGLYDNNIGPDGAKAVASEIAKCPTLSTLSLYLQSNNIGPDGAKAVASEIAKCPTLSTLSLGLQSNNIGPDGAKAVASEIAKCPTLSTLSLCLYDNNIGPDGAKAVASEIAKCPTLSTLSLYLQSNNIGPDGAKAVASEIAKCPTLSTLTLGLESNNIGPDGAKAVASEIAKCPTLSTLTLGL
ncbi:kinase domain protein, partial (macronuclear) [Tetrahymena thermophila SB210]